MWSSFAHSLINRKKQQKGDNGFHSSVSLLLLILFILWPLFVIMFSSHHHSMWKYQTCSSCLLCLMLICPLCSPSLCISSLDLNLCFFSSFSLLSLSLYNFFYIKKYIVSLHYFSPKHCTTTIRKRKKIQYQF